LLAKPRNTTGLFQAGGGMTAAPPAANRGPLRSNDATELSKCNLRKKSFEFQKKQRPPKKARLTGAVLNEKIFENSTKNAEATL
jgi:hypothetical protein